MGATQCCLWVFLVYLTVPGPERHRWSPRISPRMSPGCGQCCRWQAAVRAIAIVSWVFARRVQRHGRLFSKPAQDAGRVLWSSSHGVELLGGQFNSWGRGRWKGGGLASCRSDLADPQMFSISMLYCVKAKAERGLLALLCPTGEGPFKYTW